MTEGAQKIQPARCLFQSPEKHSSGLRMERSMRNFRICQEAKKACQRSVDRLRELYHFDVESLSPVQDKVPIATKSDIYRRSAFKLSASCNILHNQENSNSWCWEAVKTEEQYIPVFYHSVKYHSEGCLQTLQRQGLVNPPSTPNKHEGQPRDNRCQSSLLNDPHFVVSIGNEIRSRTAITVPAKQNMFTIPPILQIWGVRIRRSSYSECLKKPSPVLSYVSYKTDDSDGLHYSSFSCVIQSPPKRNPWRQLVNEANNTFTSWRGDAEIPGTETSNGSPCIYQKETLRRWRQLKLEETDNQSETNRPLYLRVRAIVSLLKGRSSNSEKLALEYTSDQ